MKKMIMISCLLLIGTVSLFAQESDKNDITIDDLSWLAGHWYGMAFGSESEEIWNTPSGGTMVGTFKLFDEKNVNFYEIIIITIDSTGPILKLKHFNADLTGWEEKGDVVTFPFKNFSHNQIDFDGISYNRFANDSLLITLEMKQGDGSIHKEEIKCHLIK
jgi:uncharacterized protein DUF6265